MMRRYLVTAAVLAFLIAGLERAAHYEEARAGALSDTVRSNEHAVPVVNSDPQPSPLAGRTGGHPTKVTKSGTGSASLSSESTYQGRSAYWWARRAVQARKDANARGRTIRRLQREVKASGPSWQWLASADCVHQKEAPWDHNGGTYDGGMQADASFQQAYGAVYLRRWGPAYRWPWWAQLHMAFNGWTVRGWNPWPNTARACGLL